ncbi:MAG TPA: NAD-dependent succinate-semialdehyde dehydrogenase [Candidatus Eremiobacteraceae bacterium]
MSSTAAPVGMVETRNPATGASLQSYAVYSNSEIDGRLATAYGAFAAWKGTSFAERSDAMLRLASFLRREKSRLATLMTTEMGKPIVESEAEVEKCAWCCEYYAESAQRHLADDVIATNATRSYVAFRPLGVILAIMPWNFPLFQVIRFAVPAIMAGNVAVLKHAANVTGCGLELERSFAACGIPNGVFTTLVVPGRAMDSVIRDPRVAAVTFTGSEQAGATVASAAASALKKTVLELGGSDAYIVLSDADVDAAAQTAVRARFQNTGQSCIAAKRFIVDASVYKTFLSSFTERARTLVMGDPLDRATQIGPLAREDLRDDIERQVSATVALGAKIALGGKRRSGPGCFYEPTIVSDVVPGMPMFDEETFGPAAAVIQAQNTEHAITLANLSMYGLGGNLWTRDIRSAESIAARLQSGAVFINGMTASDPRLPFGGVKRSGYGRELSYFGLREFTNAQTVWLGPVA